MKKTLCFLIIVLKIFLCNSSLMASSIWYVPPENQFFMGREETLNQLNFQLNQKGAPFFALLGIGGIGKTQVAKKYTHLHLKEYDFVWWFDASKDLNSQFYELGNQWRSTFLEEVPLERLSEESLVTFIKNILSTTEKKWLLIFDNAGSYAEIEKYLPSVQRGPKKIIVTSRNPNDWKASMTLPELSEDQAVQFLEALGEIRDASKEVLKIVRHLKRHPLSLVQAASFIKSTKLSSQGYLELCQKENLYRWLKKNRHQKTLDFKDGYKDISLDFLDVSLSQLKIKNPKAYGLLGALSLVNHHRISFEYGEKIYQGLGILEKEEAMLLLEELKDLALIEERLENGRVSFSMHDIIQSFVKDKLTKDEKILLLKKLMKVFKKEFNQNWDKTMENFQENPELFEHLSTLAKNLEEENTLLSESIPLKISFLENHLYHMHQYVTYEALLKKIEGHVKNLGEEAVDALSMARLKIDKIYLLENYDSLEKTHQFETEIEEAINYFEKETINKEERLRAYTHKAQYFKFQGKFKEALKIMNQVESLYQEVQNTSYKILFLSVKALVLKEIGDYQEGERVAQEIFPLLEKEPNIPLKLSASIITAKILMDLGKREESFKKAERSYEVAETYYMSPKNEICAAALMIMAQYYKDKGDLGKAQHVMEQSISLYSDCFGGPERHPDQGVAYAFYGDILVVLGRNVEALKAYRLSEKICRNFFKDNVGESPFLGDLFKKMAILGVILQDSNIPRHYLILISQYFGTGSPHITEILKHLDKEGLSLP